MDFEWDDAKANLNRAKHGVRFSEAVSVWLDENALEMPDPEHSQSDDRWIRLGLSSALRVLIVVYAQKIEGAVIRIISARKAIKEEQLQYNKRVTHEKEI
jgi:uncharacterized protein